MLETHDIHGVYLSIYRIEITIQYIISDIYQGGVSILFLTKLEVGLYIIPYLSFWINLNAKSLIYGVKTSQQHTVVYNEPIE